MSIRKNLHKFKILELSANSLYCSDAFKVLSKAFVDEPLTRSVIPNDAHRSKIMGGFIDHFREECTTNGLSLVCVDTAKDPPPVAGALICRDFAVDNMPDREIMDEMHDVISAVEEADRRFIQQYSLKDQIVPGHIMDVWMLGIHPQYGRCGVGAMLSAEALRIAKKNSFKLALAECTGAFSRSALERAGFRCSVEVPYKELNLQVEAPHKAISIMTFEL